MGVGAQKPHDRTITWNLRTQTPFRPLLLHAIIVANKQKKSLLHRGLKKTHTGVKGHPGIMFNDLCQKIYKVEVNLVIR